MSKLSKLKKQRRNNNKILPASSTVIVFGEIPITICVPEGTLIQQKEILKKRIKDNANSLVQQGILDKAMSDNEIDQILEKAVFKKLDPQEVQAINDVFKPFGYVGKDEVSGAPIVNYSKKLDESAFKILKKNAKSNSWEHTGIYGTYQGELGRFSVEINAMWTNCVNLTRLVDDEKFEAPPNCVIPAGEPGTSMSLPFQVKIYESRHGFS